MYESHSGSIGEVLQTKAGSQATEGPPDRYDSRSHLPVAPACERPDAVQDPDASQSDSVRRRGQLTTDPQQICDDDGGALLPMWGRPGP